MTQNFFKKAIKDGKTGKAMKKNLAKIAQLTETAIKNRTPVDTGRLRNSFVTRETGFLEYEVATAVKYAPHLEFGTVHMAPRAMMRRGARDISKSGTRLLSKELREFK